MDALGMRDRARPKSLALVGVILGASVVRRQSNNFRVRATGISLPCALCRVRIIGVSLTCCECYIAPTYINPPIPPGVDLETVPILKALNAASLALADLKGQARTIPNQGILIDTLALQKAKASSEVENIITTQDELFQAELFPDDPQSPASKEVALYRDAMRLGYA